MARKHSKKGFETSVGFIVILIITIVIFVSSIAVIRNFFTTTNTIQTSLTTDAQQQIEQLLSSGTSVAIVPSMLETSTGKSTVAGIGWVNVGTKQDFCVVGVFSRAFNPDDTPLKGESNSPPQNDLMDSWLLYDNGPYSLGHGEHMTVKTLIKPGFLINDQNDPPKPGLYIFNVCIIAKTGCTANYAKTMKTPCRNGAASVGDDLYTGKVYKLQVRLT